MKNKGCLIAGCAGALMVGVVVVVLGIAGTMYFSQRGKAAIATHGDDRAYQSGGPTLPTEARLSDAQKVQMVATVLEAFNQGIQQGTLRAVYYQYCSRAFKDKYPPENLDEIFAAFLSSRFDIDPAPFRTAPTFTENRINSEGDVRLAGDYLSRSADGAIKVTWKFGFRQESAGTPWSLVELNLHAVPMTLGQ